MTPLGRDLPTPFHRFDDEGMICLVGIHDGAAIYLPHGHDDDHCCMQGEPE